MTNHVFHASACLLLAATTAHGALRLSTATASAQNAFDDDCTDCLKCPQICGGGLKCRTGESGGICTECTGEFESPCGDKCCLGGQECHKGGGPGGDRASCDIP